MSLSLFSFFGVFLRRFSTGEKIHCFHCDEKMRKENALLAAFNGNAEPVCCHGCLAILQVIVRNGMTTQYLHIKSLQKAEESSQ